MRLLKLRQWMVVGLVTFVVGPATAYHVTKWLVPAGGGLPPAAAVTTLVLLNLNAAFHMGKYVVRPLEAMSTAARQVAAGNLQFRLPESRVREVADVCAAFDAMGEGLQESIQRQAELEEERRFFIAAIAHDLRTPLFALRGYLEGLERGITTSPEQAAHYVAVCRQKSDQLDRLVSDLFAYTKTEYLEQTLQPHPFELSALMRRAVDGVRAPADAKGIVLETDGPDQLCVPAGDEHLLGRAIENLLDNALRYTPPGGRIDVCWRSHANRVVFTIADTGPGIAPTDLPHLFEPLFRGETSRSRQTGGAGLGLAIARRALRAHGGELLAANRPADGAEFTGWLPLPVAPPTAVYAADARLAAAPAE